VHLIGIHFVIFLLNLFVHVIIFYICCRPGCSSTVLHVATKNLTALTEIIDMVHVHDSPAAVPSSKRVKYSLKVNCSSGE